MLGKTQGLKEEVECIQGEIVVVGGRGIAGVTVEMSEVWRDHRWRRRFLDRRLKLITETGGTNRDWKPG